jgi:hypothetical protein
LIAVTYTKAVGQGTEHVPHVKVAPLDRVYTGEYQAPLERLVQSGPRVGPTYQGIQQPHSGSKVAYLGRVEQESDRDANEDDGVIQIYHLTADSVKVQIHEQSQEEKTPTGKLWSLA